MMRLLWKSKKAEIKIGVGRFVEVEEQRYDDFRLYPNPKMRIECREDGLEVVVKEDFMSAKIHLDKKDALALADAIRDHFTGL